MNKRRLKLNNSGAALVLVIVVISFISISATILLYVSAINFYMKTTDTRVKVSFYDGEKAMEEIRAVMISMAEEASEEAYTSVMMTYGSTDPADTAKNYKKAFAKAFKAKWEAKVTTNSTSAAETYLRDVVDTKYSTGTNLSMSAGISTASPTATPTEVYAIDETNGVFVLKTVNFSYANAEGYLTLISSDFTVTAPNINFEMDADAATTDTIKIADCVTYTNWTKK